MAALSSYAGEVFFQLAKDIAVAGSLSKIMIQGCV
jgi:hypothetical protein